MTKKPNNIPGLIIVLLIWACQKNAKEPLVLFDKTPVTYSVTTNIAEASGIAGSKINPGYLWVHEDSGNPSQLHIIKNDGTFLKSIFISNAVNMDWEDMALSYGPHASINYLYLADIGDNNLVRPEYIIYRFEEPLLSVDTVSTVERIRFQYPDGAHDAEAFLVDDASKDIYIITKSDNPSRIYKLVYPQSTTFTNQAILVGQLSFGGATSAALSGTGKEIIIKTYPALSYFEKKPGETIEECLKSNYVNLPYQIEPQGEAVGFAADDSGFYTLSEKGFSSAVTLFFYKRR
ncbi:MAG: hypothetical protein ACXWCG_02105 [Flavitalea sp.]